MDNYINIVAQQKKAIQRHQLSAIVNIYNSDEKTYPTISGNNGRFSIKPTTRWRRPAVLIAKEDVITQPGTVCDRDRKD